MEEKAILILLESTRNYGHKILLFYNSVEEFNEEFLEPLYAKMAGNNAISLKATRGMIEDTYRHFSKDYNKNRRYKISVSDECKVVDLEGVYFFFEDDDERNVQVEYDNWNIKNIVIDIGSCTARMREK